MTYFVLAFAISWGGFVLVVGPGGFPGLPRALNYVAIAALIAAATAGKALVDDECAKRAAVNRYVGDPSSSVVQ